MLKTWWRFLRYNLFSSSGSDAKRFSLYCFILSWSISLKPPSVFILNVIRFALHRPTLQVVSRLPVGAYSLMDCAYCHLTLYSVNSAIYVLILSFHLRFSRFSFFLASVMHIVSIIFFFKLSQLNLSTDTFHGCFTPKICCILTWMSFVDVGEKCTLIRSVCDWCLIVAHKRRLLGWNFSTTIVDISPACWFVLVANCHTRYSWIGVLKIRKSSKCVFSFFFNS